VIGDPAVRPLRPLRAQPRRDLGGPETALAAVGIAWRVRIAYRRVAAVIAIDPGWFLIGTAALSAPGHAAPRRRAWSGRNVL
jgi:hypothetical protein